VNTQAQSALADAIDKLLQQVLNEIDERNFSADDFVVLVQRVTDLVAAAWQDVEPSQQKRITMILLQRIADFILPKIQDENVRAAIRVAVGLSGTFYDILREKFRAKFDVNKDGEVTPEEFRDVCRSCCVCCAPPPPAQTKKLKNAP